MSRTLPALNGRLIGLVLLAGAVVALVWAYLGSEHGAFAGIDGVPRTARAAAPPAVTATATPLTCETYNVLTATATIVPGTFDIGNHCDDCVTTITLPFPAQLYGQIFTSANISSNGDLYFGTGSAGVGSACQPTPGFTYAIFAFPDDLYTVNSGYGVFTSISGSAPNRIFNVEWRAQFFPGTGYVNFEIRLYEAQQGFDIIYGTGTSSGPGALVQRDVTCYTSYCHTVYPGLLLAFGGPSPSSPTPSPTPAPATATASPTACYYPNPVQNPGFETGQLAPWVIDGFNNPPAISTAEAHSGTHSVFVGSYYGPEPNGDSSLYQQITVPPTGGTLSFWYWPCGDFGPVSFDWQDAYVTDLNGNILATIMHIDDTESCMWLQSTFNMASFAGQTVRIKFLVHEDGFGDVTFMYVDDVAILAPDCLTITPSPTSPPPTASPTGTPTQTTIPVATPTCAPQTPSPLPATVVRAVGAFFPANGRFYIVGGRSSDAVGSDFTHPFEYDPAANTWITSTATYPDNQVSDMACGVLTVSGTPYIYCVGGSAAGATTATARVFRYNPVTEQVDVLSGDEWPGNPGGNTLPGGFGVVSNKLYVIGGFQINVGMTQQTWQFDPTQDVGSKWTQKLDYPVQRGYIPAVALGGMIYTAGGALWTGSTLQDTNDSYSYNPTANVWTAIANIPRATEETHALSFGGRMWIISGGRTPPNPSPEVDMYDPITNSWSVGAPMNHWLRDFAADSGGGHIWLAGGYNGGTDFYIYPPLVACQTPTPSPTPGVTGSPTTTSTAPAGTPSPTAPLPTATSGCCPDPSGTGSASCSSPDVYSGTFDIFNSCQRAISGIAVFGLQASAGQGGPWDSLRQSDPASLVVGPNSHVTTTVTFSGTPIPAQYAYYRIKLDYIWANCDHAHTLTLFTGAQPVCEAASPSPTATPTACPERFSDVPVGSTFYQYIRCLACRGIINGYPDGTFKPNANVTRGQLAKIVSNSAGFHDNQTVQMFQDVPAGSTFFQYIGRLASRGYISGYPCGGTGEPCVPPANLPYFRPNSNATRGQISKIGANAAGFSDPPSGWQFEDVPPGSTYYTYTYRLATRDVMQGYQCGGAGEPCVPPPNLPYFRPNNNATRGQTSKIVANTFFPDCQTPARR